MPRGSHIFLTHTDDASKKLYIFTFCLLILTGCSNDFSKTDKEYNKRSREMGLSGTTITVMASNDWIKNAEMDIGSNFEAATGVQVIYDIYPDDIYLDTLFKKLNSDNPPDIFLTQSGFAIDRTYHLDEYAIPLENEPWYDIYDVFSANETSIKGVTYGMTYSDTTTDFYIVYNKKLFEKAGIKKVPTTFKEFTNACDFLLLSGIIPIYEPMADGWCQAMLFAEIGQVFEYLEPGIFEKLNNNEIKFSEIANMKTALEQIQLLAQKGYMGKNYEKDTFGKAVSYLASGEYAMSMLKPGAINAICSDDLNNGYKREDFGLMLLPICDNQILNVHPTAASRFISKKSENIDAAKLYFEYITERENIQNMIDKDAAIDDLPFNAGQTPKHDDVTLEFLNSFDDETSGMVLQDTVTYFNEQWSEVSSDILAMCKGDMTPDEVLSNIDKRRAEMALNAGDAAWK